MFRIQCWANLIFNLAVATVAVFAISCTAPRYDGTTLEGKAAIKDAVGVALSKGDCATAIGMIEGLYWSENTDNDVRLLRASAYGCNAGINFFKMIGDLADNSMAPPDFWDTMAKLFPSVDDDDKVDSALFAMDSLMATIKPSKILQTANAINVESDNPGSVEIKDREDQANIYMLFVSMAVIGTIENRYGIPDPSTFRKTQDLPWSDPAEMDEAGCAYAGAILNLLDSIGAFPVEGKMAEQLQSAATLIEENIIGLGCDLGCQLPGCDFDPGECMPCPKALRHRTNCKLTGTAAQAKATCAAAGLIMQINQNPLFGWRNN